MPKPIQQFSYKGLKWRIYKGFIEPQLIKEINLSSTEAKALLKKYKAFGIRWIKKFTDDSQLWFVVQRKHLDYSLLSQNTRSKLNRAKKYFSIQFSVHRKLIQKEGFYIKQKVLQERRKSIKFEKFEKWLNSLPEQYKFIGIFENEKLVGYVLTYDSNKQLHLREFNVPKEIKQKYANYLLFFEIGRRFLQQSDYEIIVLGLRNLRHPTQVQKFAIEKFGYEKLYVRFGVLVKWWVKVIYLVGKIICKIKFFNPVCALVKFIDYSKN